MPQYGAVEAAREEDFSDALLKQFAPALTHRPEVRIPLVEQLHPVKEAHP
jgi:hypothetical protein